MVIYIPFILAAAFTPRKPSPPDAMPRTLPWLNGSSTNRSTHLKPKKSQKALFSDSDDDTPSLSTKPALKQAVPSKAGMYSVVDESCN